MSFRESIYFPPLFLNLFLILKFFSPLQRGPTKFPISKMQLKVHTTSLTNFSHKTWSFDNREFSESSVVAAKVSPTKSVCETKFVLL